MTRFAADQSQLLANRLDEYSASRVLLLGAAPPANRDALVFQFIESLRRIEFVRRVATSNLSPERANADSPLFDPIKAASIQFRNGNLDEAYWLVFLATHFGKHVRDNWRLARDVYRGDGIPWTFGRVANAPGAFQHWLEAAFETLRTDGINRRFGNHRKYETLRPDSERGTGRVFETYVAWIGANRGHAEFIDDARQQAGSDPKALFDFLYHSMDAVKSFGRTSKFDFLTMVGKLGFVDIEPGIPYLVGATGPLSGSRLLFSGDKAVKLNAEKLDQMVADLGGHLGLGMQVMEDSLCNWQKAPGQLRAFRG